MSEGPKSSAPPLIETPDGSRTAYNSRFGEAYGSQHGAASQAEHVFLQGTYTDQHPHPKVLEIGFGVGVNFRSTLANAAKRQVPLHYVAYEFDPAPVAILQEVAAQGEASQHPAWQTLLEAWESKKVDFTSEQITVQIHFINVLDAEFTPSWATALYLDGFSPTRNPEIWTPELAKRLAEALATGGTLATYSAAGHVRRALAEAGLEVERRPGAPGKRHCIRATKTI